MPDGTDREFRDLVHRFLIFAERLASIRNSLGKLIGLAGAQYTLLTAIAHLSEKAGVPVSAVAKHLHASASHVTMETAKLVDAGLVRKRQDSADRRRVQLMLSDRGAKLLLDITRIQQPVNDALFESLSSADFQTVARIMGELVDCADRADALLQYLGHSNDQKQAVR